MPRKRAGPALRGTRDQPVARGFARALRIAGRALREKEAGIVRDPSLEGVHHYRVALRTTRAIFGATGKLIKPAMAAQIKADFRWLSQRTSPVRDLDVLLEALPGYCELLPEASGAALVQSFDPVICAHRARYASVLCDALKSSRYAAMWQHWTLFLRHLEKADRSVTLGARIDDVLRKPIRKLQDFKSKDFKHEERLHTLRTQCKRLRYMLEVFQGLFEPEPLQVVLTTLRATQTMLGDYWDIVIHQRLVRELAPLAPDIPAPVLAALLDRLTVERDKRSTQAMRALETLQTLEVMGDLAPRAEIARA